MIPSGDECKSRFRNGRAFGGGPVLRSVELRVNCYSVSPARCNAGNALEVLDDVDVLKAGVAEQGLNHRGLTETELERKVSAGYEGRMRGGNKTTINIEPVLSAEQGDRRLVFANLRGDQGTIRVGNIGRIGEDDVELLTRDRSQQIAFEKTDVIGHLIACCVIPGNREG